MNELIMANNVLKYIKKSFTISKFEILKYKLWRIYYKIFTDKFEGISLKELLKEE